MDAENYLQKKFNNQGYRILDGTSVHYVDDPDIVFEWALIDRGEGRTPAVGHWVKFTTDEKDWSVLNDIEWNYDYYFNTLEEAEVYYREMVCRELREEIYELQDRLKFQQQELSKARKTAPKEEE